VRRLLTALLLTAMALPAADVTGTWLGTSTFGRRNQVQDFAFRFVQNNSAVTGKVYMEYGSTPILKGVVDGDKLSFEIVAREQNGNEINEAVFRFTGVIRDGEIEITRQRQEIRNVGNSGGAFSRGADLTFKVKRLP